MSKVTLNPLECALDEAQALRGQVDALQAERAKLRQQLADVTESVGRMEKRNAKLREMAVSMLRSIRCFEVCSELDGVSSVDERHSPIYEQWMRELGVEVP